MRQLLAVLLSAFALQVFGQTYPAKPVHLIISFTPGSSVDIVGRAVAAKLSEMWGQQVVAENRMLPYDEQRGATGDSQNYPLQLRVPNAERVIVRIRHFDKAETVDVPFEVSTGIGL